MACCDVMKNLRRAQQRLGRDAAPVKADAAEMFALDERGLQAELRRADGGDIAAGSAADDDDIVSVSAIVHCTTSVTGFSISALNAPSSSAPSAPSMARWSQESVDAHQRRRRDLAVLDDGRSSPAPTARMDACGGLMTAEKFLDAEHAEIGDRGRAALIFLRLQLARPARARRNPSSRWR